MSLEFYLENSYQISKFITNKYSTSFSLATSVLEKEKRYAIYAIYGFVRLADEIVDSFHGYDKRFLLDKLNEDLDYALKNRISTNPILTAFADTVAKYKISKKHIDAFMQSMEFDLNKSDYVTHNELKNYIYGSADVVGLMCLKVFCDGNEELFEKLKNPAQKLGSAFQKVNFLRDLKFDINDLGRSYFPEVTANNFNLSSKQQIEASIEEDFQEALKGIKQLPGKSKFAVALAYFYYQKLFQKIKRKSPEEVLQKRFRISNFFKILLIIRVYLMYKLGMI
jgi:phytoene/squalene synthetase